jgi:CHAT domain-containing protein
MFTLVAHALTELSFCQKRCRLALPTFNQARQIFSEQESPVDVAYVDLYRSDVYLALNLWNEALELAQAVRQPFLEAEMPWEVGRSWLNEAVALARLDDGRSPKSSLEQARLIFGEENNDFWLAFTDLYEAAFAWRQGDGALARRRAQSAVDTFRQAGLRSRTAQGLVILAEADLLEGDLAEATTQFNQAFAELEKADLPAITYACHYGLGRIAQADGRVVDARNHYRQSIQAIERLQAAIGAEDYKIAFLSDKLRVYEAYTLLCLQAGSTADLPEAFATVEQAKSRALLDVLAREPMTVADSEAEVELVTKLNRLKRELNWYYNRLNGSRPDSGEMPIQQMRALTTAVTEREQALSKLLSRWRMPDLAVTPRNPIWTVALEQIQAALPAQTLLVEFYMTDTCALAFGVSSDESWCLELPVSRSTIADALGQLRFQMNKFGYGRTYSDRYAAALLQSTNDSLKALYDLLLQPLCDRLTADTLIVVPHSLLHYVPFHALYDGERYLLQRHAVSYAPSATMLYRVLSQTNGRARSAPTVIGLSDATIPFAQNEAESIAQLFPDAQLQLGNQATISSMKTGLSQSAFLHLSTHATFRSDNPLFSALKLADGWLSVNDLYTFAEMPPLVTLSACETGRYQVAVGDELLGLCRGLLAAGAQSIVVSLWTVEDESTARLMTQFYSRLQQGESLNDALRDAQRTIMAEKPHPYFWAPFVLIGDIHNPL